jgi:hypothetical protein
MSYFIILDDNTTIIQKQTIDEALLISHCNYILREDDANKIYLVNDNNDIINLKIGSFEVIDMNDFYYTTRYIHIYDDKSNRNKKFSTNIFSAHFFTKYLIPLMTELNLLGNFGVYERIKSLEAQVQNLKSSLDLLNATGQETAQKG